MKKIHFLILGFFLLVFVMNNSYGITGTVNYPFYYMGNPINNYDLYYNLEDNSFSMRLVQNGADALLTQKSYTTTAGNVLTTNKCIVESVSQTLINVNFDDTLYNSYYKTPIITPNNYQQILNNNYYMKNKVEYMLKNSAGTIISSSLYIANDNLLVRPEGVIQTSYSYTGSESYLTPGQSYSVWIKVTPIDMKCDFSGNGILETTEYQSSVWVQLTGVSITAPVVSLNPGICGTENNVCTFGTSQNIPDTSLYLWNCQGDLGTTATSCSATIPTCSGNAPTAEFNPNTCSGDQIGQTSTTSYVCSGTTWVLGTPVYSGTCSTPCSPTYSFSCNLAGNVIKTNSCTGDLSTYRTCTAGCSEGACILDVDHDGFADAIDGSDSDTKIDDWCPGITTLTGNENRFNGCPYEYSIKPGTTCQKINEISCGFFNTCSPQTNFIESSNTFICNDDGMDRDSYFAKTLTNCNLENRENSVECGSFDIKNSLSGSGRYACVNEEDSFFQGEDLVIGYCDLRFNGNLDLGCNVNGIFIPPTQMKDIYKYKKVLKFSEDENNFFEGKKRVYCNNGIPIINGDIGENSLLPEFRFVGAKILSGPEYDNLIRDPLTGELKVNDTITIGKLSCDSTEDICSLKVNSTSTINISLTTISQTRVKEIKIIKDGTNIRNDTIDISLIAMQAHKIQRFTNTTNAENFIGKSYDVMTKFDITKNLTYNSVTNKTTVRIIMNNIPESDKKNLTLYMIVDKSIANSLEDISNIEEGNAEFFVVDKDPIIGWYFNESGSDEEIGYEVGGDTEGGTVIITQTPILYNEGELIINYRETNCSADELTLFELDNLIDSKVYAPGSSELYKVCLTHLDSNVNLALGAGIQSIDVMSYTNTQNASSNPIELANKITLSTDNSSLYWDVRVQKENPSGNYSCIGSLDLVNQTSLFGDCGYNEDARVWIHLGDDYNGPETTISYPGLAHTLKVTLNAFEPTWESGIENLSYIVLEDNLSFTTVEDDTVSFMVTCPNDWNCKKTVEYYAYDKAGNKEETKTRELLLIDKGSACQSDCTAKPSPNRYLKECTNLNSCEFYQFNEFGINDGGDYVANKCDYLAIGSWATYNQTHEILCPKGPFRQSRFTIERVNAIDESNCENILKTPYPVIFDGENIIMNVVSCINYEE